MKKYININPKFIHFTVLELASLVFIIHGVNNSAPIIANGANINEITVYALISEVFAHLINPTIMAFNIKIGKIGNFKKKNSVFFLLSFFCSRFNSACLCL